MTQISILPGDDATNDYLCPDVARPLFARTLSPAATTAFVIRFGTLADPARVRLVHLLAISPSELCGHDLARLLGMSASALSHQLRLLRERGAVTARKTGRIVYYRLVDEQLRALVCTAADRAAGGD